jgi:hypothetical protein
MDIPLYTLTKYYKEKLIMSNPNKEIVRYIRYNRGDRRHPIGAMVAFKRNAEADKFYIGWSLKHEVDWAVYGDVPNNSYIEVDQDTKEETEILTYPIVNIKPFNKVIALETARKRGINWAMTPCDSKEIPESIINEFILFTDRAMRYFKTEEIPEWISNQLDTSDFKSWVEEVYQERERLRANEVKTMIKDIVWHQRQVSGLWTKISKVVKPEVMEALLKKNA